jgi:hypothetical protein
MFLDESAGVVEKATNKAKIARSRSPRSRSTAKADSNSNSRPQEVIPGSSKKPLDLENDFIGNVFTKSAGYGTNESGEVFDSMEIAVQTDRGYITQHCQSVHSLLKLN